MRTIKIFEHISLDGVVQHTADENGFAYTDWTAPYRTPEGRELVMAAYGADFDLLLGRRTYDLWAEFWPKAPESPLSKAFNTATKYVATHRPQSLGWGPSQALGPDVVGELHRMKKEGERDLILSGSSTLTTPLLEHGLAEELMLIVYPVLLGTGKRLFAERALPRSFELVSSRALPSGVVLQAYKAAGGLKG